MWLTIIIALTGLSYIQAHKWSYDGEDGPLNWHKKFPGGCDGKSQSPIDIVPEETTYSRNLKDFAIWYDPPHPDAKFYIKNNGHTAQVELQGEFYVANGGLPNVYKAVQFHFHWGHKAHHGSEHTIDGKAYPIELHLVTYNKDLYKDVLEALPRTGGLAVLGVMFEISEEDNPALDTVIKALKHIRPPKSSHRVELPAFSIRDLLPSDITRYYRYNGSLTTPNCFESVIWTVFDRPQTISESQLSEFRRLLQVKHKRHRRSLGKAQYMLERQAEDIKAELGLDVPATDLLDKATSLYEYMSDMPAKTDSGPGKSVKDEKAGGHNSAEDKHHGPTASSGEHHSKEGDEEHENMVNNYRPVQPIHERRIYRSFKLSVPAPVPKEEAHYEETRTGAYKSNKNSVAQAVSSVSLLLATLILSVILC
ncbi:Carbonic anhydrase 14 [Biomphalaria glabrata]|uniref:Carbonic anhydrase n=1 Tax=Biomphalaria glabrata TaxID=6526 RepID=A0A9U8E4X5_BIOGL|nr:carbonic anhydrase 14-like [Biomphalaria glabrata]KAI8755879.1 carbonic anhydrase 6 [Biomphalaria glabrata]